MSLMLRDIGLFGTNQILIQHVLNYHENKFGGYRFRRCLKAGTRAIKKGHVKFDDISSLLNTTFMTWDWPPIFGHDFK